MIICKKTSRSLYIFTVVSFLLIILFSGIHDLKVKGGDDISATKVGWFIFSVFIFTVIFVYLKQNPMRYWKRNLIILIISLVEGFLLLVRRVELGWIFPDTLAAAIVIAITPTEQG